jgi:hypothetical protein
VTGAWTSINHRAFVAWTAHFKHKDRMLAFLLDIVEVPESHSGLVLAKAFQKMLESYGLEKKAREILLLLFPSHIFVLQILTVTADKTLNDAQREDLAAMDNNSFEGKSHVWCFNHTLQLAAEAFIRPFIPALGKAPDVDFDGGQDDLLGIELHDLDAYSRKKLIEDTAIAHAVVSKLCQLSFSITRTAPITLLVWRRCCRKFDLEPRILPRDVTRWRSTFDMLSFALEYRTVIDAMTGDKSLNLRKFELGDEEWEIVEDLASILQVTTVVYCPLTVLTIFHRDTKTNYSFSPKMRPVLQQFSLL